MPAGLQVALARALMRLVIGLLRWYLWSGLAFLWILLNCLWQAKPPIFHGCQFDCLLATAILEADRMEPETPPPTPKTTRESESQVSDSFLTMS